MGIKRFADISLIGDKELEKMFRELPLVVEKRVIRKAQTKAMRVIQRSVLSRVPVLTGTLKRGIKSRALKSRRRGIIGRVLSLPDRASLGVGANTKVFYPAAVEYGREGVPAIPFLRGGFDAAEEEAFNILKREIGAGIVEAAKKLAR